MTTTTLPASNPAHAAGRLGFALVLLANAVRMSWEEGRTSPFDVVLWSGLGVVGLYGCTLLWSALAARPLTNRSCMQLEGLGLLVLLAVAGASVLIAAVTGDRLSVGASAVVAVVNGLLLWVVARQLRDAGFRFPADSPRP